MNLLSGSFTNFSVIQVISATFLWIKLWNSQGYPQEGQFSRVA